MAKRILLIEDDLPTIELYEEVFKREGFEIETLRTGYGGIEKLKEIQKDKKGKPDLILLDLILPDVNGIVILKTAKSHPKTKDILIFALTNYTDPELTKELIREGADKFLVKTDYTPSKLVNLVKEVIK